MIPDEGLVRRKRPRTAAYHRYIDHDRLRAWLHEQQVEYHGMHIIDAPLHGEPTRELWYFGGQRIELNPDGGDYIVLDSMRIRVYGADQMEEFFDVVEGED